MTEDEKVELIAKLVLWIVECPIKLDKDTVNVIIGNIHLQIIKEKLRLSK